MNILESLFSGSGDGDGVPSAGTNLARLRRLEKKVDMIMQHLGLEYTETTPECSLSAEAQALALDGRVIGAIKVHREQTGLGLKEAKDAVDAFLRANR